MTQAPVQSNKYDPDAFRMSIGEHLEQLRAHLIRALIGAMVAVFIGVLLASKILEIILQPVVTILQANHLDPRLQVLNPQEGFVTWIKVALFTGLLLAGPYLIWELWQFVAAGLYPRERGLVRKMIPPSIVLFAAGVLFFFFIVLPVALNFFVSFAGKLTTSSVTPNAFQRMIIGEGEVPAETERPDGPRIATLPGSPKNPEPGDQWIDTVAREYRVATLDGVLRIPLSKVGEHQMVQSQFRLREYITFVGMLALSFGGAFQMPVVVIFLARTGVFETGQMARARKYIFFGISIAAAILTPTPDVINMLLLALPMVLLFEAGLFTARMMERKPNATPPR